MCINVAGEGEDECSSDLDCGLDTDNENIGVIYNSNNNDFHSTAPMNLNTNTVVDKGFIDTHEHWSKDYIDHLNIKCQVEGYKDEKGNIIFLFKPDNFITRAELVKILIQCQYGILSMPKTNPFPDVSRTAWYAPYIAKGKELNWIHGYKDRKFRPNQYINRAEATKIIILSQYALSEISSGGMFFLDTTAGAWYERFVSFAQTYHYIDGYLDGQGIPTGYFGPQNHITRAETAKIISLVKGWQ
jgi:hypothetical protein